MSKLKTFITNEVEDYKVLLRSVPSLVMIFFVTAVVLMNLFANKELLNVSWLALDCGFLVSWMTFLCMDMLTKRFGGKAAAKLSILATGINLITCSIFYLISLIPGNWSQFYNYNESIVNDVIDATIGGTWYVLLGSTIAFIVAAVVNSIVNVSIGKVLKRNNFRTFAVRSYVSTAIGQFVDNFVFAMLVSHVFFGWTTTQVIMCSITGAVAELIAEIIFSPIGFRVCRTWEKHNVGDKYLEYRRSLESR